MTAVHVLGNAGMDLVLPVPRLPRRGETLIATGLSRAPGGKGLNQAVMAARCGVPTFFTAPIGDDPDGRAVAAALAAEGLQGLRLRPTAAATDISVLMVADDAENTIVSTCGCADLADDADLAACLDAIRPGDWLLMQGNLAFGITLAAAQGAAERSASVLLNTAPVRWDVTHLLPLCAGVVANGPEAEALTGTRSPAALRAKGAGFAIVTLGADGCAVADSAGIVALPAQPVRALDTTGAGDAFCGTLAAALANGAPLHDAVAAAQSAAALTVCRPGAYAALPTREELRALSGQAIRAS